MSNKKFKIGEDTYIRKLSKSYGSCNGCCFNVNTYNCCKMAKFIKCINFKNGQDYIIIKVK